ncbi:hypothetical protein Tco_0763723 [Tanacetum coccineum]
MYPADCVYNTVPLASFVTVLICFNIDYWKYGAHLGAKFKLLESDPNISVMYETCLLTYNNDTLMGNTKMDARGYANVGPNSTNTVSFHAAL